MYVQHFIIRKKNFLRRIATQKVIYFQQKVIHYSYVLITSQKSNLVILLFTNVRSNNIM